MTGSNRHDQYLQALRERPRASSELRGEWKNTLYHSNSADEEEQQAALNGLWEDLLWLPVREALRYVNRYNSAADCEDLVQVGTLAIRAALLSWDPRRGANLWSWVRRYVQTEIVREDRRERVGYSQKEADVHYEPYDEEDLGEDPQREVYPRYLAAESYEPEFCADTDEQSALLLASVEALRRLYYELGEVVQLVYVDGLTQAQAAERLGISQKTVSSRISRACLELKSLKTGYNFPNS